MTRPRACVVGAGSSGITAVKALRDRGIPFDCFEKSDRVGGNWVFGNRNGMSSVYRSLRTITSKPVMSYADFPMPAELPDFPHHTEVARYLDAYVDRFELRDLITFATSVERAARDGEGLWHVTLDTGETRVYDVLLAANGHNWDPRWPEPAFLGRFDGLEMHSHDYVDAEPFAGMRVVVVGIGNSAMDIAVESSRVAERVMLSTRRGAHVIPKYVLGRPMDQFPSSPWLPFAVRRWIEHAGLRAVRGRVEDFGLPRPDHRFGRAAATISSDLLGRAAAGAIDPKPNVAELRGDRVAFADGSVEAADAIVYCTGYRMSFPFFDRDITARADDDLPLFHRVFDPEVGNVFFVGLLQPWGAVMPLAEAQSRLVAEYLCGEYALPSRPEMERQIRRERNRVERRYVGSKRHAMVVDAEEYLRELARERRRGRRRAGARGRHGPIPARAERVPSPV